MSNAQFRRDYAAIIKKAGDRAEMVVRASASAIGASLVERSPVGDPSMWKGPVPAGYVGGRFKNNWQYGVGSINTDTSAPPDQAGGGSTGRINQGLVTWRPGQTIFITQSLPYAYRLEHGWSQQAPSGMVRLTVLEFQSKVRQAAEKLK